MIVVQCYTQGQFIPAEQLDRTGNREFLEGFLLCNDAFVSGGVSMGDPTEIALMEMSRSYGLDKKLLEEKKPRVDEKPFDSKRKMMTTVHRERDRRTLYSYMEEW